MILDASKYNDIQIQLMEERLILLNENDHAVGTGSKKDCHLIPPPAANGEALKSPLHRAFSVFLFHPTTGKLLLQKRADEKITFPNMWTNTCCSHPLSFEDEADEKNNIGVRRAASRKLTHELGIKFQDYTLDDLVYLTRIHYYAKSDDVWAEHEIDYILFLTLDPEATNNLDPSLNEVSDVKWVSKAELIDFFNDSTNEFTPWFKLIAESFLYKWWDLLASSSPVPLTFDAPPSNGSTTPSLNAKSLLPIIEAHGNELGEIIRM